MACATPSAWGSGLRTRGRISGCERLAAGALVAEPFQKAGN
jgi:hypothetical protein